MLAPPPPPPPKKKQNSLMVVSWSACWVYYWRAEPQVPMLENDLESCKQADRTCNRLNWIMHSSTYVSFDKQLIMHVHTGSLSLSLSLSFSPVRQRTPVPESVCCFWFWEGGWGRGREVKLAASGSQDGKHGVVRSWCDGGKQVCQKSGLFAWMRLTLLAWKTKAFENILDRHWEHILFCTNVADAYEPSQWHGVLGQDQVTGKSLSSKTPQHGNRIRYDPKRSVVHRLPHE